MLIAATKNRENVWKTEKMFIATEEMNYAPKINLHGSKMIIAREEDDLLPLPFAHQAIIMKKFFCSNRIVSGNQPTMPFKFQK